jgi:hypothetical protein
VSHIERTYKCPFCNAVVNDLEYWLHLYNNHTYISGVKRDFYHKEQLAITKQFNALTPVERIKKVREDKINSEAEKQLKVNDHLLKFTKTYNITWKEMSFGQDCICFSSDLEGVLNPAKFSGVFKDFNQIKTEYFLRLFGHKFYKLTFVKGRLDLDQSPHWERITNCLQRGLEFFDYKFSDRTVIAAGFTKQESENLFFGSDTKNVYLKYLALNQSESYRIIPIKEVSQHHENCFLFRMKTANGKIFIIWENSNDKRANYFFITSAQNHDDIMNKIQSYICSAIKNKRERFYLSDNVSKSLKKELSYVTTLWHNDVYGFTKDVESLVSTW